MEIYLDEDVASFSRRSLSFNAFSTSHGVKSTGKSAWLNDQSGQAEGDPVAGDTRHDKIVETKIVNTTTNQGIWGYPHGRWEFEATLLMV